MKTSAITTTLERKTKTHALQEEIIRFYEKASIDYSHWSKDLNMHFGYFIFGKTNPFRRDSMLNEMNDQVYQRLDLDENIQRVADLGCGMGGTMRYFLKKNPKLFMFGVTLSPFQVSVGNRSLNGYNGIICEENYEETTFASESLDGAVAIESLCHSGHSKESLREAYRILKPGKTLVIADCFIKKDASQLCFGSRYCYDQLCKGWSLNGLGNIHDVAEDLKRIGFRNVQVEDISWRVAPSVFHVPAAILGFLLKKIFRKKQIKNESQNNLKASFYSLMAGLHRRAFGYYIITTTK